MRSERQTVLLHFSRRGEGQADSECVPWPPAEVTLADVSFDGERLEINVSLTEDALSFRGSFQIPLGQIARVDVVAGDCVVIQTFGLYVPRLIVRASSRDDAFALSERIRAEAQLR
ncbi:MAG TPA: hypothetical protein VFN49_07345 [Candidatus Aquilonibacter sp.]|nr:hypothetical protein [Candidatus Aquilonibacter sp.]